MVGNTVCNAITYCVLNICQILNMMNYSETVEQVLITIFPDKITYILAIHQVHCKISNHTTTCTWMNSTTMSNAMDCPTTYEQVNLTIASNAMGCSATRERVNLTIASNAMGCSATRKWVNLTIASNTMDCSTTCEQVDLTIVFNVIGHSTTRERVNLTITSNAMDCSTTCEWVNLIIAPHGMDCSATHEWVNLTIAPHVMDCSATCEWVNPTIMSNVIDCLVICECLNFTVVSRVYLTVITHNIYYERRNMKITTHMTDSFPNGQFSTSFIQIEHADINNQHNNIASTFSSIFIDMKKYRFPPTATFLNDSINTCFQHINQCDESNTIFWYHYFIYLPYKLLSPPLFWSNQICGNIIQLTHMLMTWEMNPFEHCRCLALCIRKRMMQKHDFLVLKTNINYHFPKLYFVDFIRYLQKCSGCVHCFFQKTSSKKTLTVFVKPTKDTHTQKTNKIQRKKFITILEVETT